MNEESCVKNWLTASVLEFSCKKNFASVIEKILKDKELSSSLHTSFADHDENERLRMKPIFLLIEILRQLLSSVETFSQMHTDCQPWDSGTLPKILNLLEKTYEQCEFISLKKFFSLLFQLKFLDLMRLLQLDSESSALMQKLNLHFPRWHSSYKASLEKQFFIENPKILDKVEESCSQCRRLILKLATDNAYKSIYMKEQFSKDMKKMMIDSVILLNEVITNLSSNAGLTVIEKSFCGEPVSADSDDLGHQLLLDFLQPEVTAESLLKFLNEMESALEPPTGGFSSCLLPFDTLSECSDVQMDSDCDESGSECGSEDSSDEKDKTLTDVSDINS